MNKTTKRPRDIDLVSIKNISVDFQIVIYLSDWFLNLMGLRLLAKHTCRLYFFASHKKKKNILPREFLDFVIKYILTDLLQINLTSI